MNRARRIVIVGGGLGGLTAARAVRLAGCEVVVVEQADHLKEIGAGINMSPNAVKVLRDIGVEAEALNRGFTPADHVFRDWRSGRALFRLRVKDLYQAHFGAPHLSIHRSDLHDLLRGGLPEGLIVLGSKCVSVETNGAVAAARLANGQVVEGDCIVGADGIKSTVRECLFGPDAPKFTGNVAWRFTVPTASLPAGLIESAVTNWLGPGGHVVHYYVRAGELVNVVAVFESETWSEESWSQRGDKSDLQATYAGWNTRLHELFSRADTCFKWGIFDRDPLQAWTRGRVTLLGDAAHPMLPFLGQGAAMAMEDGLTLGLLLRQSERPMEELLQEYERVRIPRTTRAQFGSRARASENHLRSPLARFRRNLRFRFRQWINPAATLHNAEWLYSYHPSQVVGTTRPPAVSSGQAELRRAG